MRAGSWKMLTLTLELSSGYSVRASRTCLNLPYLRKQSVWWNLLSWFHLWLLFSWFRVRLKPVRVFGRALLSLRTEPTNFWDLVFRWIQWGRPGVPQTRLKKIVTGTSALSSGSIKDLHRRDTFISKTVFWLVGNKESGPKGPGFALPPEGASILFPPCGSLLEWWSAGVME